MATIQDILDNWLNLKEREIKSNYNSSGMKASGKFGEALRTQMKVNGSTVVGSIIGASHSYYVDHGRGATSPTAPYQQGKSLKELIRQWIDDKGIQPDNAKMSKDSLAYLIARKIHREGWKPKNAYPNGIISSVINDAAINELLLTLGRNITTNIKSDVLDGFKDN